MRYNNAEEYIIHPQIRPIYVDIYITAYNL